MKILKQLKELQRQSAKELNALEQAIQLLRGRKRGIRKPKVRGYHMSVANRGKIARGQKLRWVTWHAKKKVVGIRRIA